MKPGFDRKLMSIFFIASKLLTIFLTPLWQFALLIAASWLAGWAKWRRLSRLLLGAGFVLFILYSWLPFSQALLRPLENYAQIPSQNMIAQAKGIIVLGGFTGDGQISADRDAPQLGRAAERFFTAISLHKHHPDKPIWFTGFSGKLRPQGWSEDRTIERLLTELRLPVSDFYFERKSRNTAQNAQFTYQQLVPAEDEKWILITSASHMMRADLTFKKAGWPPLMLMPVDYQTRKQGSSLQFSPAKGFDMMQTVFHEYVGLLFYKLTGRL